jgi:hypothetical protein
MERHGTAQHGMIKDEDEHEHEHEHGIGLWLL